MIEDPIERQRRNKSQKPFVDRQKRPLKQEDYVVKDLNNFMLEPWAIPDSVTPESTSGKASTSTAP